MFWNYRVLQRDDSFGSSFTLIEAYYEKEDPTKVMAYSEEVTPYGELLSELKHDLDLMIKAFDQPVLTEDDLPEVDDSGF